MKCSRGRQAGHTTHLVSRSDFGFGARRTHLCPRLCPPTENDRIYVIRTKAEWVLLLYSTRPSATWFLCQWNGFSVLAN
ncbi:unnamed protein product, partial [Musa acuminata var. zebrina]